VQLRCRAMRNRSAASVGRSWVASWGSNADDGPADPGPNVDHTAGRQLSGGRANSRRSARLKTLWRSLLGTRRSGRSARLAGTVSMLLLKADGGHPHRLPLSQEAFGHGREVADSAPGDVEDGVGDGGRDADDAEVADALAVKRADVGVMFVDEGDVDWGASAWVGMRYSFKPGLSSRAVRGSVALASSRAWPMPMTAPPRIWLSAGLAVQGLSQSQHAPPVRAGARERLRRPLRQPARPCRRPTKSHRGRGPFLPWPRRLAASNGCRWPDEPQLLAAEFAGLGGRVVWEIGHPPDAVRRALRRRWVVPDPTGSCIKTRKSVT